MTESWSESASTQAGFLAENLRALREARGLSQQQMAKLANVPRATWTHLESGASNPETWWSSVATSDTAT